MSQDEEFSAEVRAVMQEMLDAFSGVRLSVIRAATAGIIEFLERHTDTDVTALVGVAQLYKCYFDAHPELVGGATLLPLVAEKDKNN